MTVYVFNEYRDKAGIGSNKVFDTKEEAISYAQNEWDRLFDSDKKTYKEDPIGAWEVILCDAEVDEDGDIVPDMTEYDVVWSALE